MTKLFFSLWCWFDDFPIQYHSDTSQRSSSWNQNNWLLYVMSYFFWFPVHGYIDFIGEVKFMFILHACGRLGLGARTWKKIVTISYKVLVVLHWVRPEAKITKSSVKCVHNSALDAKVCQSSVCRYLVYDWNFDVQSCQGCPSGCATRLAKSKPPLQPLCQSSHWATQPLWQSGWISHPATLAERLEQPLSHSARVADARVADAATQPLNHSSRAAEWLSGRTKPLWQNVSVGE